MPQKTDIENLHHGKKIARNSMYMLVALSIIKAIGGYTTNTVALLGDAASTFGDLITMIAIFVGLSLSLRPPNKRFKYGYHRIETLVTLVIAILMIFFGFNILTGSIGRIITPEPTKLPLIAIITSIISIVFSIIGYYYQKTVGEKINSSALQASAIDKRNDAFVSGGIIVGIGTNELGFPIFEKLIGVGIAIAVLYIGIKTVRYALLYLLDYWDEPETTNKIKNILEQSTLITDIKNLRLRHAGTFIFGDAFLEVTPFTDIIDLRDEVHRLNNEIKEKIPHLGDFNLHVTPPKPEKVRLAIPVEKDEGLKSQIPERLDKSFYFMIIEIEHRKVKSFTIDNENPFTIKQSAPIAMYLKKQKVDVLISSHVESILFYFLRLNHIKLYPHFSNVRDVYHTIKLLLLDI
jgi:cation diffusion facilitator family transporter